MTVKGMVKKKKEEPTGTAKWKLISAGVALIMVAAVAAWWIGECDREEGMDTAAERIEGHFAKMPGHDVTAELGGAFRDLLGSDYGIAKLSELAGKHGRVVYHEGRRTVWYGYRLGTIGSRQGCVGTVRRARGDQPDVSHEGFGPALEISELRLAGDVLTVVVTASTSGADQETVAALGLEPGGRYEATVDVTKIGERPVGPDVLGPYRKVPAPTEPAPTEPTPTEPAPTEPAPTEPAPTENGK